MNRRRSRLHQAAGPGLLVLVALASAAAPGQDKPAASYDEWRLLESAPELANYKNSLREGGFDNASRKFLVETALPQLGLPKNRPAIDFVRRRMREVLCGDGGSNQESSGQAMQVVTAFMTDLARDGNADIVTRVNAALLVGELRSPGNKPWTDAVAPLVKALGDDALPPAVRIAAASGLARHVEADPRARAADVGPTLLAIAGAPLAGVDPAAADWLRSRALAMLGRMGPDAPDGTAAAAAKVLLDATRPVDVRVRAAAVVGRCIKAAGDTDVAAAIAAIRGLADEALAATKAVKDRLDLAFRLAGGDAGQPQPERPREGVQTDGTPQAYRRDAWRLATLADALAPANGDAGLARFEEGAAAVADDVAKAMREGAVLLDEKPDSESLEAAIKGIAAAGKADAAAAGGGEEDADPDEPEVPEEPDGVPVGER